MVSSENQGRVPVVFVCHASEDGDTARELASHFHSRGIDTFFDEWEIGPGDSLRQKIEHGLSSCTHFMVLLTPRSIGKPWVNAEIDAGFIRKVEGKCKFIPLRQGLTVGELPSLLRALHSPELADAHSLDSLADRIHGLSIKPSLGTAPATVASRNPIAMGLSPAAESIVRMMIEKSENGYEMDTKLEAQEIRDATKMSDDAMVDGVDELDRGLITKHVFVGSGDIGFSFVTPKARLFYLYDEFFRPWIPLTDAKRIAADLVNGAEGSVPKLAESYDWLPRRMNPAVSYLQDQGLVEFSDQVGTHPWCTAWIAKSHATRRWVQSFS